MARRAPEWPAGILLIDKPQGWTSHDVVAKARGICRQRRIGHTGTLDPMATGLLVLCLGRATRLVEYMAAHEKRYEGEVLLGVTTDTDDAEGQVIARADVPVLTPADLRRLEARFTGTISQVPPAYSAVKVDGQRAYSLARRGGDVALAARSVRIDAIRLEQTSPGRLSIALDCGPGTYVRSIARDIGVELECGAHLASLRRLRVGRFDVTEAMTLEQLDAAAAASRLDDVLLAPDEGVAELPAAILSRDRAGALRSGVVLELEDVRTASDTIVRVYDSSGYFIATGQIDMSGLLRPAKVMPGNGVMSVSDTNSN
jgi:tRNA pseudouridine55 synthase